MTTRIFSTLGRFLLVLAKGVGLILGVVVLGLLILALIFWALPSNAPEAPKIRVDVAELHGILDLDIPIAAVKWQAFHSPEDDGVLWPAQDVQTIFIAEIDLADPSWFKPRDVPLDNGWVAAESARPWLSEPFRVLMQQAAKDKDALAKAPRCGVYEALIKKDGKIVDGYICKFSGKILLYLTLDAPT